MTVAFYVQNDDHDKINVKSTVKFGSIDKIGLKSASKDLELIRTKNKTTWDLRCSRITLDKFELSNKEYRVRFEPQMPYIYLPSLGWQVFASIINTRYTNNGAGGLVCSNASWGNGE